MLGAGISLPDFPISWHVNFALFHLEKKKLKQQIAKETWGDWNGGRFREMSYSRHGAIKVARSQSWSANLLHQTEISDICDDKFDSRRIPVVQAVYSKVSGQASGDPRLNIWTSVAVWLHSTVLNLCESLSANGPPFCDPSLQVHLFQLKVKSQELAFILCRHCFGLYYRVSLNMSSMNSLVKEEW